MGVQQHRRPKARVRRRRAIVMKLESPKLMECPRCHEYKLPHRVCPGCGYYNERQVVAEKKEKKEK